MSCIGAWTFRPVTNRGGEVVAFTNRNPLDNRRCNLRAVTPAENQQNVVVQKGGKSRFRGVTEWWSRKGELKWRARVTLNDTQHYLGLFETEQGAAAAASAFRREHMPYSEMDKVGPSY